MSTQMDIPRVHTFDQIRTLAEQMCAARKPRAALVVPSETDTLPAFAEAVGKGLIEPFVIGDENLFRSNAVDVSLDPSKVKIIDINQPDMAVQAAAKMAEAGEIDMIIQGQVDPNQMVSLLTSADSTFVAAGPIMSHVGVLKTSRYAKLLFVTDGLVHAQPDLSTKIALLGNLAKVAKAVGISDPRTAVVTAVEVIYPQMPATTDGAVLAKMSERGQIKGVRVDGPLSFDVAVDPLAAEAKGITGSPVAGQADAMLASTRQVAQGIYQAMSLYADCESGGILIGGRVPVAVNFVTEPVQARLNSILLATLLA
jgi:phosphate butyryltransferase